ncbi:hypothetical protein JR316_0007112 [Psilocybe cubensis]|uniref:Uncharacterized protein n=1 Tax=Psilocybe cubensis TaxID=181762 RepID=A0ACB8GYK8_PSICU|nr:hypothetical protein JR316_0007112 [Psilocybe cubensis]KAH9480512.1 hypothetical protein JR316_0007112 [Psilocybe cubensis]
MLRKFIINSKKMFALAVWCHHVYNYDSHFSVLIRRSAKVGQRRKKQFNQGPKAKYLEWQKSSGSSAGTSLNKLVTSTETSLDAPSAGVVSTVAITEVPTTNPISIPGTVVRYAKTSPMVDTVLEKPISDHISNKSFGLEGSMMHDDDDLSPLKRPRTEASLLEHIHKKTKLNVIQLPVSYNHEEDDHHRFDSISKASSLTRGREQQKAEESQNICEATDEGGSGFRQQKHDPLDLPRPIAKRFKAPLPKQAMNSTICASRTIMSNSNTLPTSKNIASYLANGSRYLDFYWSGDLPSLPSISLPPTVSQRKQVARLSLVLSAISFDDLKSCSLVSRVFRYSAYLSAFHQLLRKFPGKRLQTVLSRYSVNMTNFWPYLHFREKEMELRKRIYEQSFLPSALKDGFDIDERLWSSPDHEKQLTVALRWFLITKLYFVVSVGNCTDGFKGAGNILGKVVDAQEIIEDEIWKVTYCSSTSVETFYVIQETCEVIGGSMAPVSSPMQQNKLRIDWGAYIRKISDRSDDVGHIGLSKRLRWTNHEEYEQGISKAWLKRIQGEGQIGLEKLSVANRYVLACVTSNSISGPWRTVSEMMQEFDGRPSISDTRKYGAQNLNLFLPAHHHVESVHFTTTYGEPLHPALAVVQTPAREYFILKDNGMQVGCEEEGIALVWIELIKCTSTGRLNL